MITYQAFSAPLITNDPWCFLPSVDYLRTMTYSARHEWELIVGIESTLAPSVDLEKACFYVITFGYRIALIHGLLRGFSLASQQLLGESGVERTLLLCEQTL